MAGTLRAWRETAFRQSRAGGNSTPPSSGALFPKDLWGSVREMPKSARIRGQMVKKRNPMALKPLGGFK